ncbi:hypothetical protein [Longimicrobium sp.]|uniref:hypothetical protein n=1 Tax=Longimicrobium sp. TaxID=2029185 RepID=UPI002E2F0D30|nr:hypothetical protein [Longimicrobium sp.]HEX6040536.1 hypothetical protein [Longimicrobium sp.]
MMAKRAFPIVTTLFLGLALAGCSDQPVAPRAAADSEASHTVSEALNAYITGPTQLLSGQVGTWTANPSGGDGTYTYLWQYKKTGSTLWTNVGTGSTYSRASNATFDLKLTVSSAGSSVVRGIQVTVPDACGSTC